MATAAAEIEFIPDEPIEFIPDDPIEFIPDEPVNVPQEAMRATAGALQAVDLATLPGRLDWSEAAGDEVLKRRAQADELYAQASSQPLNPETPQQAQIQEGYNKLARKEFKSALDLEYQLRQEAPLSSGAQRLSGMRAEEQARVNEQAWNSANFLGRGLSGIAQSIGLTPLAHTFQEAGRSPMGLNFQANIGAAVGGAAGAGMMMIPGGQVAGARTLAQMAAPIALPIFGGMTGGMGGGIVQEKIQEATETPQETLARQDILARTREEAPLASLVGGSLANAPFMRPSLSQFAQAMSGNRTAAASIGAAAGIGSAIGILPGVISGQPVPLSQIAYAALENTIFNRPTRLGRALGLPAAVESLVKQRVTPDPSLVSPQDAPTSFKDILSEGANSPFARNPENQRVRSPEEGVRTLETSGIGQEGVTGRTLPTSQDPQTELAGEAKKSSEQQIQSPVLDVNDAGGIPVRTSTGDAGIFGQEVTSEGTRTPQERGRIGQSAGESPADIATGAPENPLQSELSVVPEVSSVRELQNNRPEASSEGTVQPVHPTQGTQTVTGIRNAIVDAARAEAGIPPRELPLRRSFPEIHEEARVALADDPEAGRRLVKELGENIRPLTDTEDAVLTFEQNARQQERAAAVDAVNNAPNEEARETAQTRLAEADNALFEVLSVGQQAGTANARGLNARRLMQNQDFTLANMLNEKRAIVNGGEPLTKEQTAETEALYKRISELESKLAGTEAQEARRTAQTEYQRILRETKREAGQAAKAKRSITDFMDDAAEKARQRIISRRGRLQVTVDPLNIAGLVDEAIIGASYVAKGVRNAAEWGKQMISEFGERIRPHLDALFAKATALADETNSSFASNAPATPEAVLGNIKEGAKLEQRVVYDLARAHVNAGMDDFNQVMARVTEDLKPRFPNITERQVMDALSGYGKTTTPSKQEDLRKLREFRNLARLTSQLEDAQKGTPPKKTGPQRDKPTARVRELQKKVNEAMRAAGIERTGPEQIASGLQASKTRIRNQIEELQDRINRNDYAERPKAEPAVDREKIDLQFELSKVKEKWNQGLIEAKRAKRPLVQKVYEGIGEGINLARQLVTSGDFPPVFRQGLFSIGRPITTAKAVADSFKAMVSERQRFKIMQEIDNRPNAPLYNRSKLYLARDTAQPLSQMEENFMGNWFKQLPRWTVVGPLLRASERSYNTFLNKLRADTFDTAVRQFNISETDTASLRALAANINTFTGRSTLPTRALEQGAPALNTLLFAPRFMMSRFKVATGQPLWGGTAKSRLAALDTYARTLGGVATIYALAQMSGGEVETDPRSSDFGKIRMGDTRLDPLGGLSQVTTFLTRLTTGETKTAKGKLVPLRETMRPLEGTSAGAKGKPNMIVGGTGDVLKNFLRSKLNPAAGTVWNALEGKDITGKPVTPASTLVNTTVPISYQDILSTMEKQGVPRGAALFTLSLFGMGLNTYEYRKK